MQIKTQTEYAILVLMYLAERRSTAATSEISLACGMNETYVPKLMKVLKKNGWVSSSHGSTGGYRIAILPCQLSLMDIMKVTEDSAFVSRFSDPKYSKTYVYCTNTKLKSAFEQFQSIYNIYFSGITLDMLMNGDKGAADRFMLPLYHHMEGKAGRCANE